MPRTLPALALMLLTHCASGQSGKIETTFTNSLEMPFVRVASLGVQVCRYETRVKDYEVFATATNVEWKKPDFPQTPEHPAINVSFTEVQAFCEWLGKKEGRKYRLLTDTEWSVLVGLKEKADVAPNQQPASADVYHWGTGPLSKTVGNFCDESFGKKYHRSYDAKWLEMDDGYPDTAPVGSYPADLNGLHDLSGNVWEWVDGWYDPPGNTLRIVRGGAFRTGSEKRLLASFRGPDPYNVHLDSVGFRIVCERE